MLGLIIMDVTAETGKPIKDYHIYIIIPIVIVIIGFQILSFRSTRKKIKTLKEAMLPGKHYQLNKVWIPEAELTTVTLEEVQENNEYDSTPPILVNSDLGINNNNPNIHEENNEGKNTNTVMDILDEFGLVLPPDLHDLIMNQNKPIDDV